MGNYQIVFKFDPPGTTCHEDAINVVAPPSPSMISLDHYPSPHFDVSSRNRLWPTHCSLFVLRSEPRLTTCSVLQCTKTRRIRVSRSVQIELKIMYRKANVREYKDLSAIVLPYMLHSVMTLKMVLIVEITAANTITYLSCYVS